MMNDDKNKKDIDKNSLFFRLVITVENALILLTCTLLCWILLLMITNTAAFNFIDIVCKLFDMTSPDQDFVNKFGYVVGLPIAAYIMYRAYRDGLKIEFSLNCHREHDNKNSKKDDTVK